MSSAEVTVVLAPVLQVLQAIGYQDGELRTWRRRPCRSQTGNVEASYSSSVEISHGGTTDAVLRWLFVSARLDVFV